MTHKYIQLSRENVIACIKMFYTNQTQFHCILKSYVEIYFQCRKCAILFWSFRFEFSFFFSNCIFWMMLSVCYHIIINIKGLLYKFRFVSIISCIHKNASKLNTYFIWKSCKFIRIFDWIHIRLFSRFSLSKF